MFRRNRTYIRQIDKPQDCPPVSPLQAAYDGKRRNQNVPQNLVDGTEIIDLCTIFWKRRFEYLV